MGEILHEVEKDSIPEQLLSVKQRLFSVHVAKLGSNGK